MPTIDQLGEWVKAEQRKGNGQCHTNHPVIMEHVRKEAIKNSAAKTRIALECYSPRSYAAWNEMLEYLMERCGCNPLLVVDMLRLLVHEARTNVDRDEDGNDFDGITIAKHGLCKLQDYEAELREARAKKKAKHKRKEKPNKFRCGHGVWVENTCYQCDPASARES